tara:strand:+ start:122 stop:247 length:126 start_codon:yes stop_codon:yes gene_type:complete
MGKENLKKSVANPPTMQMEKKYLLDSQREAPMTITTHRINL